MRRQGTLLKRCWGPAVWSLCALSFGYFALAARGQDGTITYSFSDEDSGGAAWVTVDAASGLFRDHQVIFDVAECGVPLKIRRDRTRDLVVVTDIEETDPQLFMAPMRPNAEPTAIGLPSEPDELRLVDTLAMVTCDKDEIVFVELTEARVRKVDQLDKMLKPPANGPEDIHIGPEQQFAIVSLQKDSGKGKKLGNRLLVYSLAKQELVADLRLPRDRPDLHIEGNLEQQGPGPEVIHVSAATNTLAVTLDLYGGVALMDWDAARQGQLSDYRVLSGSLEETWGNAFPDRVATFRIGEHEFMLVSNAGTEGGSILIDLNSRRTVWSRPTPPGLESAVYVPSLRQAFSVVSGKTKWRADGDVQKEFRPRAELVMFDFRSADAVRNAPVTTIPLPGLPTQIVLASQSPPRLLIAVGQEAQRADTLLLFDPVTQKVTDQRPAAGIVGRLER